MIMSIVIMLSVVIVLFIILAIWKHFTGKDSKEDFKKVANIAVSFIFFGLIIMVVIITLMNG